VIVKLALGVAALPALCLGLCTLRVEPVHGWMMRHDCPLAKMARHPPMRPAGYSYARTSRIVNRAARRPGIQLATTASTTVSPSQTSTALAG
jgi:hypothetical protein